MILRGKEILSYDKEIYRVTKILVFLSNEHPVNRTILIVNVGGVKFPATEPY